MFVYTKWRPRTYGCKAEWIDLPNSKQRIYSKSSYETRFARWLDWLYTQGKIDGWYYEPKTFWFEAIKRGVRSYKPDFIVLHAGGGHEWFEVKGYMDAKSKTKLKRFAKYYPEEKITVVDLHYLNKHCNIPQETKNLENKELKNATEARKE